MLNTSTLQEHQNRRETKAQKVKDQCRNAEPNITSFPTRDVTTGFRQTNQKLVLLGFIYYAEFTTENCFVGKARVNLKLRI